MCGRQTLQFSNTKDEDELDSREDSERYDDRTGDEESQDGQRYGDKRERDSDDQSSWSLSKKKKRKQSNPIRYQSLCSPLDLVTGKSSPDKSSIEREASSPKDLSTNENSNIKCPHCTECFASEEILANHINLDHVQKMIEKQLLQFHQFRRKASSDYLNFPIGQEKQKEDDESGDEKLERLKSEGLCPTPFGLSMSSQAQAAALAAAMSSPLTSSSSMGFPQIPGLIPSMPHNGSMDMQQPVNLSLSMGAFPGHVPPYLIPLFPQGHSPPVTSCPATSTSSASHTPSGMRIFNPEAYCELCHKEFCNKYFLKTHKANKHGIYSMDSFVNLPYGNALFAASLAANTLPAHLRPMLGPSPPVSEPNTIKGSGIINKESYCEVCDKEFCNKYFLKKHKLKIHGVDILPGVTEENTPPSSSTLSGSPSHASDDKPVVTTSTKTEVSVVTSIKDTLVSSSVDQGTSSEVQPESLPAATQADDSKEQKPSLPGSISNKDSTIVVPTPQVLSAISIVTTEPKVSTKYSPAQLQSMGVINPDAFCDICCKEFCNKYFLRTHRQNKHGACASEASPGSGSNSVCNASLCNTGVCNTSVCTTSACNTSVCSTSAKTPLVPHTSEIMSDLQKLQFMSSSPPSSSSSSMVNSSDFRIKEEPSEHMELACNFCSRPFASKHLLKMHLYYNHNVPLQENSIEDSKESPKSRSPSKSVTPPTEGSKTSIEYDQVDEVSQDLSSLQNLIRELNGPSSENKVRCHMCFQEMDNKYFLRAHMMTQHGTLLSEENVGLFAAISCSNYQKVANLTNREETTSETKSHADLNMRCDICLKVFPNKVILKQHMIILHGMKDGCIRIPEHMKTELTENSEQPVQTKPRIPSSDPNSPQKQQNGSSPGNERRNYCQLCNKELCNKYFMKTHMLKMHGITVNERSSSNGVEMAGNSMIGGVTCDICHKELCSKYFLKVHKQNTHGISEDGTPIPGKENIAQFPPTPPILRQPSVSPPGSISWTPGMDNGRCISHYSEICPLCDRRFKSIKWLKTHMANDHREHIKENILLSNLANVPISIDPQAMDFAAATKVAALVQGHSLNGATENPEFLSKVIASQKIIFPSSMEVASKRQFRLAPSVITYPTYRQ
ncbi:hypothetical protein GQR58_011015 [Nymphon striatum]|nr:hypothetical protein GQR58_011015 [Nymphon striatum]